MHQSVCRAHQIVSYATDTVAAPGTRFSLVLDITPDPKVHVYAPGATGYIPIALSLTPPAGLVVRDTHYRRSLRSISSSR